MLRLEIPVGPEGFDDATGEFIPPPTVSLELEHSLVSISKWEAKWHRAFLSNKEKTAEETFDYIKCMVVKDDVNPAIFDFLTQENIDQINDYIKNPMTATVIPGGNKNGQSKEVVTSELIYYWMVAHTIPSEYQYWHLNRLLTLIQVCNVKNSSPQKRSKGDIMRSNAAINKANRARFNSKG